MTSQSSSWPQTQPILQSRASTTPTLSSSVQAGDWMSGSSRFIQLRRDLDDAISTTACCRSADRGGVSRIADCVQRRAVRVQSCSVGSVRTACVARVTAAVAREAREAACTYGASCAPSATAMGGGKKTEGRCGHVRALARRVCRDHAETSRVERPTITWPVITRRS